MSEKKRYIILFLTFLFLLKVFSCSIVPESKQKLSSRCKPMLDSVAVSESEVEAFLEVWNEYIKNGYDKKILDKVSLMEGKVEDNIPLSVRLWFNTKCWTVERFYYVEDRLRSAVRTLYLKRHSAGILSVLKERINDDNASEYQNMIDMQNKIANIENITDEELKFVQMREAEIVRILNIQ